MNMRFRGMVDQKSIKSIVFTNVRGDRVVARREGVYIVHVNSI